MAMEKKLEERIETPKEILKDDRDVCWHYMAALTEPDSRRIGNYIKCFYECCGIKEQKTCPFYTEYKRPDNATIK